MGDVPAERSGARPMPQTALINPTTGTESSAEQYIASGDVVTLITDAAIGDDPITLECKAGTNWMAIKEQADPGVQVHGSIAQISASNNTRQIHGPVTFRVVKPVTAKPVGVWLET